MTNEQKEEIEVLRSIFDGDDAIKFENDKNAVQYLFGDPNIPNKSILIEFQTFIDGYPDASIPVINLQFFHNNNLLDTVKVKVEQFICHQALAFQGTPMIYSLIESVKENLEELLIEQQGVNTASSIDIQVHNTEAPEQKLKEAAKEQLSKAQKRKMWDRGERGGEKARGWNWVDIVKHLSQTGS